MKKIYKTMEFCVTRKVFINDDIQIITVHCRFNTNKKRYLLSLWKECYRPHPTTTEVKWRGVSDEV